MILGIVLIGFAVFTFDRSTPVPSVYLLVPILGTMLIIAIVRRTRHHSRFAP